MFFRGRKVIDTQQQPNDRIRVLLEDPQKRTREWREMTYAQFKSERVKRQEVRT